MIRCAIPGSEDGGSLVSRSADDSGTSTDSHQGKGDFSPATAGNWTLPRKSVRVGVFHTAIVNQYNEFPLNEICGAKDEIPLATHNVLICKSRTLGLLDGNEQTLTFCWYILSLYLRRGRAAWAFRLLVRWSKSKWRSGLVKTMTFHICQGDASRGQVRKVVMREGQ